MTAPRGIVVGIDGSSGADAALAWAADEAARRDTRLLVTHVGDEPNVLALSAATADAVRADLACHAARLLTTAACVVEARQPGIEVQTADLWGNAVEGLIELSDDADLVVVGRRGVHRGIDALLGGVSHRVAAYGRCPVAVVPHPAPSADGGRPTIAVGVGRSAAGMEALEDAFQHAERLGGRLLAVRAWASSTGCTR